MMQENLIDDELKIDKISAVSLNETAKWAKFLAVVGFVLTGLIAFVAVFAGSIISTLLKSGDNMPPMGMPALGTGILSVTYLIIAAVYFFMSLYLFRFASNMKIALSAMSQDNLNISFHNLKNVYKVMGIITIIYLGIMVLALITGVAAVLFASR